MGISKPIKTNEAEIYVNDMGVIVTYIHLLGMPNKRVRLLSPKGSKTTHPYPGDKRLVPLVFTNDLLHKGQAVIRGRPRDKRFHVDDIDEDFMEDLGNLVGILIESHYQAEKLQRHR